MMKRSLTLLAAAAAVLGTATPAAAQLVDNNNGTVTINGAGSGGSAVLNFNGNSGGVNISGLTARLTLNFLGVVGGDYSFSYSLLNNSTVDSRVSGFAFNTNPNITGGTATGLFTNLLVGGSYPNNVGSVEACLQAGGNACQGGGNGGVDDGPVAGTGNFTLDFGNVTPASITLSDFYDRYQSLSVGTGSGTGQFVRLTPPVPEPGTWGMMLIGFGGIGFAMRRGRKSTAIAQIA